MSKTKIGLRIVGMVCGVIGVALGLYINPHFSNLGVSLKTIGPGALAVFGAVLIRLSFVLD